MIYIIVLYYTIRVIYYTITHILLDDQFIIMNNATN